ncbi:glutathione S-transferase family protein [Massilia sp. YMA4]|uniref:glutathione S-transferase family protein n=1 Tax=Massilia sp. YMA4 TaxID=1593482 RepID=UPI000DD100CE|nr:glutathione S-transferase N-terminal domain-containing protein [Massilia sp. YMA4]AXA94450.1 glutathione S-transferase family protein [Massilia sp. YMA4]
MITLHTWTTPNGRKPIILLEELGTPYDIVPVDLGKRQQFEPAFLAISPNNKIPALVDDDAAGGPLTMFESGAILTYLAEKHGQFLPAAGLARYRVLTWLHWQIGGVGPMFGQLGFFSRQDNADATGHFVEEAERLLGVLDKQLSKSAYLAGDEYSIADIAVYPWIMAATERLGSQLGATLESKASLQRWLGLVGGRPAVRKAMAWAPG